MRWGWIGGYDGVMALGVFELIFIVGLLAALVMIVAGIIFAVKSKENRAIGIALALIGAVMLLGGAGFMVFGFLVRA